MSYLKEKVYTDMVDLHGLRAEKRRTVGIATVFVRTVTEIESVISSFKPIAACPPGDYLNLLVHNQTLMSDTDMELRTNRGVIHNSRGDVFISGLGIGLILPPILQKPGVTSVTVIEKEQDVIDLILPGVMRWAQEKGVAHKLTVVNGDVFTFKPKPNSYDTIYHDIWPDICTDNLKEIATLNRKFARAARENAWVNSWVRDELLLRRRREKEEERRYRGYF